LDDQLNKDVALLRQTLDDDLSISQPRMPQQPLLVAMCGLPGTGKSYFAAKLIEQVPFLILETDRLRKVLVEHPRYSTQEHRRVFRSCYQLIQYYLINGYSVLFDATNLNEEFRTYLYDIAEATHAPLALVHATAPENTVRRRLKQRKADRHANTYSDAGWLIYTRLAPVEEPVQRDHYALDTSKDISPVLDEVAEWAKSNGQLKLD
jgi:predicted kinase|tara:strand:- start:154 stop:774 length:621 start_codon:yes stop_codon:yes gene_type:complete